MGSVSPKADGTPALSIDDPSIPIDDAEDMTSIMSAEQRRTLQQAAKHEKESATLERDTARPPPSDARPVTIPRAAGVPAEARTTEEPSVETPAKPEPAAAPARAAPDEPRPGWTTWELVAFVLLAAAIVSALRT